MRQLATLPSAEAAKTLADYLLSLKITTRLLQEPDGWAVWVCDEDRLPQARQEYAAYQENPADPRFKAAAKVAQAVRREQETPRVTPSRVRRPIAIGGRFRVTGLLIAASVVISLATNMGSPKSATMGRLTIAPTRPALGGRVWVEPLETGLKRGEVWRLVTPIFVHLNFWHLAFNMLMLYQLGSPIEARRGGLRLALLVLACAVPSNLAQYYLGHATWTGHGLIPDPSPFFGGMSGVVYGLFGYVWMKAVLDPEAGLEIQPSTVLMLLLWFFLCFSEEFQQMVGAVANMAHGAGLLVGILIGVTPILFRTLLGPFRRNG
jgi:GlpG protein